MALSRWQSIALSSLVACSSSGGGSGETDATTGATEPSSGTSAVTGTPTDTGSADAADSTGAMGPGEPFMPEPIGDPASATIGPAGGSITSTDGRLTIVVPEGALADDTLVEVQEVAVEDGFGWQLLPEGLQLATPATATITLSDRESGVAIETDENGVVSIASELQTPFHIGAAGLDEIDAQMSYREEDAALDWVMELSHFSWIGLVAHSNVGGVWSQYAVLYVGESLPAGVRATPPPFTQKTIVVSCPDPRELTMSYRNHFGSLEVELDDDILEKVGDVEYSGSADEQYAYTQELRCASVGTGHGALRWPVETELAPGQDLGSCFLPPVQSWLEFRVNCVALCTATDPVDLGMLPDGDPSLDLTCVKTGLTTQTEFTEGDPWVRVQFDGPWRPSDAIWSWYSRVTFSFADGSTGAFVTEHHLPSVPPDSQFTEGALDLVDVDYVEEETGYLLYLDEMYADQIVDIAVESGMQRVPPPEGVFVQDMIAATPFETTKLDP